ncbi:MAG: siphovirus Gp157 family protein [Balneolaceae bacterium]|nr:siphovirus Gp157 family protein [Balneolaceae bacterium]
MNTTIKKNDTTTNKETLFGIGESFYVLESLLIENEGEINETIDQWLDEYEAKEEDKIDSYCFLIQKFEEIAEESKRLAERSSSYSNKVKSLKDRLKLYMEIRGKEKVETGRFTVTVCGNGGLLPIRLYENVTADRLPESFVKVYKEPDLTALRDAILNGDEHAMQFAQILPRGTHLRIK